MVKKSNKKLLKIGTKGWIIDNNLVIQEKNWTSKEQKKRFASMFNQPEKDSEVY